ncbi:MAG TPA: DUF4097 family beta strand repeat-containing protein [Myxococcota bacterium]|nr:DUF4097 family beta strand repeat-containing protein [Myxococcota bacterium]
MSMRATVTPALIAILATVGLGSCAPIDRDEAFEVQERIERVVIRVDHGDLVVLGTDRDTVSVERTVQGWQGSLDMETRVDDGTLTIRAGCDGPLRCRIDSVVEVPRDVELSIVVGAGEIELVGLSGVVDISLRDGDLSARGLESSELAASLAAGDVDLELETMPEHLSIAVGSGDVRVSGATGDLDLADLSVASGDIEVH